MKPLGEIVQSLGVRCHQYADDTQLYFSITSKSEEPVSSLDQCLVSLMNWMKVNEQKLNPDEPEVLLDSSLSLDAQVLAVARSAFAQLKLVCQLHLFLERSDLAMVTHALVTSWLDYCNLLYVGLPMESVWKLQQIQALQQDC